MIKADLELLFLALLTTDTHCFSLLNEDRRLDSVLCYNEFNTTAADVNLYALVHQIRGIELSADSKISLAGRTAVS